MKTIKVSLVAITFLLSLFASAQPVEISYKSINKKQKYKTTIYLMDGGKHKGKLTGHSDTSIFLSSRVSSSSEKESIYNIQEYKYDVIKSIRIKRKMSAAGPLVGASTGLLVGSLVGISIDAFYMLPTAVFGGQSYDPVSGKAAGIGFATGGLIGTAIGSASRTRYFFQINGRIHSFSYHLASLKLMVIPPY